METAKLTNEEDRPVLIALTFFGGNQMLWKANYDPNDRILACAKQFWNEHPTLILCPSVNTGMFGCTN